jgi:hypothetical protein
MPAIIARQLHDPEKTVATAATGHAHHFLSRLDRVPMRQVEVALRLYNDRDALRRVLASRALPADAERVALSIDDDREGPFVIVTRAGAFVTCLGRGMRTSLPVIPNAQIVGALVGAARTRHATDAVVALHEAGELKKLFSRVWKSGPRLAREDVRTLVVLAPILASRYVRNAARAVQLLVKLEKKLQRWRSDDAHFRHLLRIYWEMWWGAIHFMTVASADGSHTLLDQFTTDERKVALGAMAAVYFRHNTVQSVLRGLWVMARIGRHTMAVHRRDLAADAKAANDPVPLMSLTAGAMAHHKLHKQARDTLTSLARRHDGQSVARYLLETLFDPRPEHAWSLDRVDEVAGAISTVLQRRNEHIAEPGDDDALRRTMLCYLPQGLAAVHEGHMVMLSLVAQCIPWIARASIEDLYLPRARSERLRWRPADTIQLLRSSAPPPKEVVIRRNLPGRNAPCRCGCARKYKKCCARLA